MTLNMRVAAENIYKQTWENIFIICLPMLHVYTYIRVRQPRAYYEVHLYSLYNRPRIRLHVVTDNNYTSLTPVTLRSIDFT